MAVEAVSGFLALGFVAVLRRLPLILIAVLSLFAFTACSGDDIPTSYDAIDADGNRIIEDNWMEGCRLSPGQLSESEVERVCTCSFKTISGPGGVAFEDFVEVDSALKSDPESLQEMLQATDGNDTARRLGQIVADCIESS